MTLDNSTLEYDFSNYFGYDIKIYAVGDSNHINSEIKQLTLMITKDGKDYIYFGKYPQTVVNDSYLISTLDNLTQTNNNGYYEYQGNEYTKLSANPNSPNSHFNNGQYIVENQIYYFKVEPIKWRILEQEDGELTLLTDVLPDQEQFFISIAAIYRWLKVAANNYKYSTVREFLNNEFYNKSI